MMKNEMDVNQKLSYQMLMTCSIGTVLEWYDFSVYAYLAPMIASLFFPQENTFNSLLLTYSVFVIGFLARPLGAIIFGHFGDRLGRKYVLIYSFSIISLSTVLIGFLPTYHQIGVMAPILLVLLRIFQGIAIGGEAIGAGALMLESTMVKKQNLVTAIVWASSGVGILLSSMMITIITFLFSHDDVINWGWRIPFLLGAITGVIGYYLRIKIPESVSFNQTKFANKIIQYPLIHTFKNFKKKLITIVGLYILSAIITYLLFVYTPVFASNIIGLPFNQTMTVNTIVMAFMILLVPLFGYYADQWNQRSILLISSILFILLSFPLYLFMTQGTLIHLIIAQIIFAIIGAAYQGALTATALSLFPINIRYTAVGFGYNLSYSIFGSTAPLVAVYLIKQFHFHAAPAIYLTLGAVISFVAVWWMENKL